MMSAPLRLLRVCLLSATLVGRWTACSIVCVVDFLSMTSPILFLHFRFRIVILVGCITNFLSFFLDLVEELAL